MNGTVRGAAVAAIVVWVTYGTIGFGQVSKPSHPVPKVVALPPNGTGYVPILGGPPESVTMESGYVVLLPSASGEKHSSKQYEEVLVVLAGVGEMRITGGAVLGLKPVLRRLLSTADGASCREYREGAAALRLRRRTGPVGRGWPTEAR